MDEKISEKKIKLKRAYETPTADDGTRVLVDRLWPRGVRKSEAAIDHWMKDLAPSTDLRKWFGHPRATGRTRPTAEPDAERRGHTHLFGS